MIRRPDIDRARDQHVAQAARLVRTRWFVVDPETGLILATSAFARPLPGDGRIVVGVR